MIIIATKIIPLGNMDVSECLQNLRIDGNELCSQFGRYMSPAYHHDKCER